MKAMDEEQRLELSKLEQMQRAQFAEFTSCWDDYMTGYELTAAEQVEQFRAQQEEEIFDLRQSLLGPHANRFQESRRLNHLRTFEQNNFKLKKYNEATKYRQMI